MEYTSRKTGVSDRILKIAFDNWRSEVKASDFKYFDIAKSKEKIENKETSKTFELDLDIWFESLSIQERILAVSVIFYKNKSIIDFIYHSLNDIVCIILL